jgi:ABC-type phosphate/phosphonate transport system substrate-binding protein
MQYLRRKAAGRWAQPSIADYTGAIASGAGRAGSRHWVRDLFAILLLGALGCSGGVEPSTQPISEGTATPTAIPSMTPNSPSGPPGSVKNPIVLALPPSTRPEEEVLNAGRTLRSLLERTTGYAVVSAIPPSETELIRAFGSGGAHIAAFSPFAYLLASQEGVAEAAFAREQDGNVLYGSQFIARIDAQYRSHFDPVQAADIAEATIALAQFNDKKPCWTDARSASGYVVPLGVLAGAGVRTQAPAFLAGHAAVVRAVYTSGICDFGATYVDARAFPGLEDQLPDVMRKVEVIWRIPPIIPYETLAFARGMPVDVRRVLIRAFVDLTADAAGIAAMQTLFGFSSMRVAEDSLYEDFRKAVRDSGLVLTSLME